MIHTLHHRWHKKLSFALVLVFAAHLTTSGTAHAGVQVLINGEVTYDAGTCGNDSGITPPHFDAKTFELTLQDFASDFDGSNFKLFRVACAGPGSLACNDFNQIDPLPGMISAPGSATLRWRHTSTYDSQPVRVSPAQHFGYESTGDTIPEHWLSGHYVLGDDSVDCGVLPLQQYTVGRYRWHASVPGSAKVAMAQPIATSATSKYSLQVLISTREGEAQQQKLHVVTRVADSLPPPFRPIGAPADEPPLRVNELREGAGYLGGNEEGYNGPVAEMVNMREATTNSPFEVVVTKKWPVVVLETRWGTSERDDRWMARVFSAHQIDWTEQETAQVSTDTGSGKAPEGWDQLALLLGSLALAVGALALWRTFRQHSASSTSEPN